MPISKKEFEAGEILSELEKKIITFLENHRDDAFKSNEIMKGVKFRANFSSLPMTLLSSLGIFGFSLTLDDLVRKGKIRKKYIKDEFYYMA